MKLGRLRSVLLGGLLTVFVPLGAYLYLKSNGYNGRIPLPSYYVIDRIVDTSLGGKPVKDTLYHTTAELKLLNQLGDSIQLNHDFPNKILIVNFFFTSCNTICPKITENMKLLTMALQKHDSNIQFISISVDPQVDSLSRLRRYADRYKVNHDKWFFCSGSKETVYPYARQELGLFLPPADSAGNDFIHPEKIVLLDKFRNIRGYYNGLYADSVRKCAEDVTYLFVEKNKEHREEK